jgi:tetratricopeptide (TPR) repeat protein
MKFNRFALFIIVFIIPYTSTIAQQVPVPDKEKLLEFYDSQKYDAAATYLQSIYQTDTVDPKALSQLGYVYMMSGRLPEAETIYLKMYAQNPQRIPVLFNLATLNVRRGNEEKAIAYYKEIITLDSTNFNVYKQLAALTKSEDLLNKIKYLKKANSLNPIDADVVFSLCELFFKTNLFQNAEKILEPALKADTANIQLLKIKMPISMAAKKYQESVETGLKLMGHGDSSTYVINNMGKSYFLINDFKNGLKYFLMASDKMEDNEVLLYNIALCYRGLKDYKNAALYLDKTITEGISKKTASYYGLLGDSYEFTNQNEEAIKAYKRGLLFDNNGSLYYNIALVYETKFNDKKNAVSYYNLYLKNFKDMDKNPKLAGFIKNKIEDLKR